MKSIAFFNNKGGVGKTTLSCNIGSHLSTVWGKRVLVIDCDPQCNASQLILDDKTCDSIYRTNDGSRHTILDLMKPISEGDAHIDPAITPQISSGNRFGVDLLPGHPAMSVVEDRLASAWNNMRAKEIGGFRITNWFPRFLDSVSGRYDLVIVDLGPSLGPLARSVLLGSHYFVTPMGCDIFSLVGIRNIGEWLQKWTKDYDKHYLDFVDDYKTEAAKYKIVSDIPIRHGFAGYTVLQYITKSRDGVRRATGAFEDILSKIPSVITNSLEGFYAQNVNIKNAHLGDIPNLYSLVPLAQSAHSPIWSLDGKDGLAGGQYKQQEEYAKFIETVGNRLAVNIGLNDVC